MKTLIYLTGAICGVAAYLVVRQRVTNLAQESATGPRLSSTTDDLAHRLQDAWADHHTRL